MSVCSWQRISEEVPKYFLKVLVVISSGSNNAKPVYVHRRYGTLTVPQRTKQSMSATWITITDHAIMIRNHGTQTPILTRCTNTQSSPGVVMPHSHHLPYRINTPIQSTDSTHIRYTFCYLTPQRTLRWNTLDNGQVNKSESRVKQTKSLSLSPNEARQRRKVRQTRTAQPFRSDRTKEEEPPNPWLLVNA